MSLTISETSKNTERQLPEAGATVGVLFSLVDLGTQEVTWDGETKWTPKLRLAFELPEQVIEGEVTENGKTTKVTKPMVVSIELTRSLGEGGQFSELPEWLQEKIRASKELSGASSAPQAKAAVSVDADGNAMPF
jgi:hypothetical protein